MLRTILFSITILCAGFGFLRAQENGSRLPNGYGFQIRNDLRVTPVKDQASSGTCWAFAAVSFIEAELLRKGQGEWDLSEMYFVRHAYSEKIRKYIRLHGTSNLGQGGQAHDVLNVIAKQGLVPESAYPGLLPGENRHMHSEMESLLKSMADALVKNPNRKLSRVWEKAMEAVLDAYLGHLPRSFSLDNRTITPSEFLETSGFRPDEYISITSYPQWPYDSFIVLEIPDNWANATYLNLPAEDMITVIHHAIENGYTVCWDGDVSDKGFSHNKGVAVLPDLELVDYTGSEKSRWEKLTEKERQKTFYAFEGPVAEKSIRDEDRQAAFDNLTSTDDHLMHLTGIAMDSLGTVYYRTKNSWGAESNAFGGYLYMSDAYVRQHTIAIMIHRDALPANIARRAKIKP